MSRMQRWSFMVQTWRWQGWHGTTVFGLHRRGKAVQRRPEIGLVGPEDAYVGVPMAAAICIRPEVRLEIATLAAAIANIPLRRSAR